MTSLVDKLTKYLKEENAEQAIETATEILFNGEIIRDYALNKIADIVDFSDEKQRYDFTQLAIEFGKAQVKKEVKKQLNNALYFINAR